MYDLVEHYNSGPSSELVYEIPLTTWSPYSYQIAYQIKVEDLHPGDLLVCNGNAEVTSEYPFNVMVCCYIVLTKESCDTEGLIICPAYGGNVDRNEHHRPLYAGGSVVSEDGYNFVSFVVYAASTAARVGDKIALEQDYGRLFILHYRKR